MDNYDVFISHASKDKLSYVGKLVESIKKVGIDVFYDEESISWGDDISKKVAEGLEKCKLAVVVISKNYFGRPWTEYELKSLMARQGREGQKIILPILYRISKKDLTDHYPELANIKFLHSKSYSYDKMAELIKQELDKRL